jgi:uncharacterized protein YbjT (DUF2867 family)
MLKTLFKILLAIVVVLAGIVLYLFLDLRAVAPESTYDLAPVAATSPDPRPVLIFGATRNTGLKVATMLRERGDSVTAAVRETSDRSALEAIGADIVVADAMDPAAIAAAMAADDFRAVISTVGCISCEPPPDGIGNVNITDGAKAAGIPRMILITTIGSGDSYESANILSRMFLSKVLPLKTQAEDHLKASGLEYTIIRPGGLVPKPGSGRGFLSEDRKAFGFISRDDLARLIVQALDDPGTVNKTFAAADPKIMTPWDDPS